MKNIYKKHVTYSKKKPTPIPKHVYTQVDWPACLKHLEKGQGKQATKKQRPKHKKEMTTNTCRRLWAPYTTCM